MLASFAPGSSLEKLSIATPKSTTSQASSNQSRTANPPTPPSSPGPAAPERPASRSSSPNGSGKKSLTSRPPYVNCWRNYTRFRTLYQILDDLGATIDIHRQSTPHDELVDRLQQHDGREQSLSLTRSISWRTPASSTTSTASRSSQLFASRTRKRSCSAASTTGL